MKKAKPVKEKAHNHDAPLQEKLKDKNWDPIKEMIEITDEYEEGTPKREPGKDYWGACCLESQDVGIAQKPKPKGDSAKEQESDHKRAKSEPAKRSNTK